MPKGKKKTIRQQYDQAASVLRRVLRLGDIDLKYGNERGAVEHLIESLDWGLKHELADLRAFIAQQPPFWWPDGPHPTRRVAKSELLAP